MIRPLKCVLLVTLISLYAPTGFGQVKTSDPMQAPNTLYGELGGKGLLYGFYYERLIVPRLGVDVGFSSWDVTVFWSTTVTIVPLFLSWYPVGEESHLYVDGGVEFLSVTASFDALGSFTGHGAIPLLGTGYCYRNSRGGFYFKVGPLFLFAPGRVQPWANLSLGVTF